MIDCQGVVTTVVVALPVNRQDFHPLTSESFLASTRWSSKATLKFSQRDVWSKLLLDIVVRVGPQCNVGCLRPSKIAQSEIAPGDKDHCQSITALTPGPLHALGSRVLQRRRLVVRAPVKEKPIQSINGELTVPFLVNASSRPHLLYTRIRRVSLVLLDQYPSPLSRPQAVCLGGPAASVVVHVIVADRTVV